MSLLVRTLTRASVLNRSVGLLHLINRGLIPPNADVTPGLMTFPTPMLPIAQRAPIHDRRLEPRQVPCVCAV